ncbi:MAG TPA: AAA family ATPase [Verrucomicrobiae bacterium]|nr:AAA family ATPase [Verrucomicrobiae bacterium]
MVDVTTLSDRTRQFLEHGAPVGERQKGAFDAACQLRDAGATEDEAIQLVEAGAARCELPLPEARAAVKSAFKRAPRELIHKDNGGKRTKRTVAAEYPYTDETGKLLFQCVRYTPKDFRQRQPDGDRGWTWNLKGVPLVLYRLPEVMKATGDVFVVEGEKDADTLAALSFTATTNPLGAGKWRDTYNEALRGKSVVIVPDNDKLGQEHAEHVARALHDIAASVKIVKLPAEVNGQKVKDASDYVAAFEDPGDAAERLAIMAEGAAECTPTQPDGKPGVDQRPVIQFFKPSELRDYKPPEGIVLVGDCHIVRGNVTVIAGPPGVGKSRAAVALAVAGATGAHWFGLSVHSPFKTLIIQNENGRFRLSREFADLDCEALEGFVRVSDPPSYGLAFDRAEFCEAVSAAIADFRPDVIVIDPWNAVARDEKAKDYLETFNAIRAVIPTGDNAPALVIVAHTRKPKSEEKYRGRDLLHVLAGSYVLGSVPRTVFVMLHASDDPTGNEVVWVCCKNNDGELGERTAWARRNGLFIYVKDFDWDAFDKPPNERPRVTEDDIAAVFHQGDRKLARKQAAAELAERTGCKSSACYNALKKHAKHLTEGDGLLAWTP